MNMTHEEVDNRPFHPRRQSRRRETADLSSRGFTAARVSATAHPRKTVDMFSHDITSEKRSTLVHAAPGGKSTFSLAHDSGGDDMTPREHAALRKVCHAARCARQHLVHLSPAHRTAACRTAQAERQKEADRQYREATLQLTQSGSTKYVESTGDKLFGQIAPAAAPKPDLFAASAPFATTNDTAAARSSTRVNAAPGGRQTLVLGSDSPSWMSQVRGASVLGAACAVRFSVLTRRARTPCRTHASQGGNFDKPKPMAKPRESGVAHPDLQLGSQMASLLSRPVFGDTNTGSAQTAAPLFPDTEEKTDGPPDTTNMTHKERVAAMRAFRTHQENVSAAGPQAGVKSQGQWPPALTKQNTAGMREGGVGGEQRTLECSIGDRPSSRVLAPPGGRSNITFG